MPSIGNAAFVAVVILNWNGKEDILRCLRTLPCVRYPRWSATVIDNDSSDGSVEAIREAFPDQRVLVMEKNLGFCGGNNRGIEDALARGADYVLLLNNDTELHPDLLTELVEVAESDRKIGAVGAKNIKMNDHGTVWAAYGKLTYGAHLVEVVGWEAPDGPELERVAEADWVVGNGMMLRRDAIEKVGVLDENFFGYHEDVDWCVRAREVGFRSVYAGRAIIYHRGFGASHPDSKLPFPTLYFLGRNGLVFARKHGTPWQVVKYVVLFLGDTVHGLTRDLVQGKRVKPWLWVLRGFGDGLLGRLPLRQLKLQ